MSSHIKKRLLARVVFFSGIFFMILGSALLISAHTGVSRLHIFASFSLTSIGIFCAALAIKLNSRSLYLFFAALSILTGLFLFLWAEAVITLPLNRSWPFLSIFSGISLLPAGLHKYKKAKTVYLVPALAFLALGCLLLIFTFRLAPFSFKQFILNWWHLLLVICGFVIVLLSIVSGKKAAP